MSSKNTESVTEARSLRSLRSRAKAKLKELLSGQLSRDETVAESSSNPPLTLPSSSMAVPDAEAQNQTSSDPSMPISGLTDSLDSSVIQNKVSDTIESSNIWAKAYKAATPDTRKWIENFSNMTISQNVGDQSWVRDILEAVRALEKKHQDSSLRITVGQKEIALRDYVVPTVKWLTLIGDISTQFAPAPSGVVWSAMKVLLQVCAHSLHYSPFENSQLTKIRSQRRELERLLLSWQLLRESSAYLGAEKCMKLCSRKTILLPNYCRIWGMPFLRYMQNHWTC